MKSLAGVAQLHKGQPGTHGTSKAAHGGRGKDTVVLVPLGTVVSRILEESSEGEHAAERQDGPLISQAPQEKRGAGHASSAPNEPAQPVQSTNDDEPEMPAWLLRWRGAYTGSALDEDVVDDFDGPATVPREKVGSETEPPSDGNQRALVHEQENAHSAVEAPLKRRGPRQFNTQFVADLVEEGQEICVARGGRGGIGNAAMKSLPNR